MIGNPRPTGCATILRNHLGEWVKEFQRKMRITNSLVAEVWGIRDDLLLTKNMGILDIYV